MKRAVLAAFAALATMPAFASAQMAGRSMDEAVWGPRIRITPFIGHAPAVSRTERWTFTSNGQTAFAGYDVDLGSGWAGGAAVEFQLADRWAIIGEGMYVTRGRTREYSPDLDELFEHEGSNFIMAKAALAMRLRESVSELQVRQLTATLFAGPAWVHERPKDDPFADPVLLESLSYWGVNFGVDAALPLADGLSLQGGVEDFLVWWPNDELARRNNALLTEATSVIDTDPSHMWIFRLGLSLRME